MTSSALFSSLDIRGVTFDNRIGVSPMAQYSASNGVATPWHHQHLGSLAVSGPGLVCIESTSVEREGYGSQACLALHNDAQEEGLREVIGTVRGYASTRIGIQFGHSGRKASGTDPSRGRGPLLPRDGGWPVWGPSAERWTPQWPEPIEIDASALQRVRAAYGQAARRAARLDLDLIELHGAHGYLLHSFLSPISNHRQDAYGGSLEARCRLVAEVVEAVRDEWPDERVLGIRLNAEDFVPGGLQVEDTIRIVSTLREAGLDYACISAGAVSDAARITPAPGYLVPYASRIRRETGSTIFVTGMIIDPLQAEAVIAEGHADMVAIARGFLDDPRWVWHAAEALGVEFDVPMQFSQVRPGRWPGAATLRPARREAPAAERRQA